MLADSYVKRIDSFCRQSAALIDKNLLNLPINSITPPNRKINLMSPYLGKFIARQRANIGKRALITLDICPRRRKVASIVCKFTGLRLFLHSPKSLRCFCAPALFFDLICPPLASSLVCVCRLRRRAGRRCLCLA